MAQAVSEFALGVVLCAEAGMYITPALAERLLARLKDFKSLSWNLLYQDLIEGAARGGNEDLLKAGVSSPWPFIEHHRVMNEVLRSGKLSAVKLYMELSGLGPEFLNGRPVESFMPTANLADVETLIKSYHISPTQRAVDQALYENNSQLVQLLLDSGAPPPPVQSISYLFHKPEQRPLFEQFLAHPRVHPTATDVRFDEQSTKLGVAFLVEKGLFSKEHYLGFIRCTPDVLLYLRDLGCSVRSPPLLFLLSPPP